MGKRKSIQYEEVTASQFRIEALEARERYGYIVVKGLIVGDVIYFKGEEATFDCDKIISDIKVNGNKVVLRFTGVPHPLTCPEDLVVRLKPRLITRPTIVPNFPISRFSSLKHR